MSDTRWRGNEGAGAGAHHVVADRELRLAVEHVERIDEAVVHVRVDALEVRPETQLDRLELRELGQDPVVPMRALHALASVGSECHDAVHDASMPTPAPRS